MANNQSLDEIFCKLHHRFENEITNEAKKMLRFSFSSRVFSLFLSSTLSLFFFPVLSLLQSLTYTCRTRVHSLTHSFDSISFHVIQPEQCPYLCYVPVTKLGLKSAVVCDNFSCQLFAIENKICENEIQFSVCTMAHTTSESTAKQN